MTKRLCMWFFKHWRRFFLGPSSFLLANGKRKLGRQVSLEFPQWHLSAQTPADAWLFTTLKSALGVPDGLPAWACAIGNSWGFNAAFPGLQVHLLGHNAIFRIPFFRAACIETSMENSEYLGMIEEVQHLWLRSLEEWCLMHGHGAVSRETCLYLLRRGHSIALAPGGAVVSGLSSPGEGLHG